MGSSHVITGIELQRRTTSRSIKDLRGWGVVLRRIFRSSKKYVLVRRRASENWERKDRRTTESLYYQGFMSHRLAILHRRTHREDNSADETNCKFERRKKKHSVFHGERDRLTEWDKARKWHRFSAGKGSKGNTGVRPSRVTLLKEKMGGFIKGPQMLRVRKGAGDLISDQLNSNSGKDKGVAESGVPFDRRRDLRSGRFSQSL